MRSYVIGRSPYADVVLAEPSVARRHAELVVTDDGRHYLSDCASETGTWRLLGADGGKEEWEPLRQAFVGADESLRLGEHRCTLQVLIGEAEQAKAGASGGPARGAGGSGRWRSDFARDGGSDLPRGRVERDPRTGEVIPKRV